jgi:hypothetical protein
MRHMFSCLSNSHRRGFVLSYVFYWLNLRVSIHVSSAWIIASLTKHRILETDLTDRPLTESELLPHGLILNTVWVPGYNIRPDELLTMIFFRT